MQPMARIADAPRSSRQWGCSSWGICHAWGFPCRYRMMRTTSASHSASHPDVIAATTWRDRALVVGLWFGAAALSAPVLVESVPRETGMPLTLRDALLAQFVRTALGIVALVVIARVFDTHPLPWREAWREWRHGSSISHARASWMRSAIVRSATLAVIAVAHATLFWVLEQSLGPVLGVGRAVLDHPESRWTAELATSFEELPPPVLVYLLLRRIVRGRAARDRARQAEAGLRTAREHALAVQLQPHFLFNVLNGIALLTRTDPRQAERMIVRLAALMREIMETPTASHALREELRLLDDYLALQQMRFGDRVRAEREIAAELLDVEVPRLLLQPLVENALRHGIESLPEGGTITVCARRVNDGAQDRMLIEVIDDGVGLPATGLIPGMGVAITEARLRLWEGEASAEGQDTMLHVETRQPPARGTCARLSLAVH